MDAHVSQGTMVHFDTFSSKPASPSQHMQSDEGKLTTPVDNCVQNSETFSEELIIINKLT